MDRGQEEFRRYLDEKRLLRSAGEFRDLGSGPIFGLCREFCDAGYAGCKMTRLRSRSKLARPYIWRLIIL
ncbi:MAG TPA: hypothetical protein VHS32_28160, partial [Streptosporangiaceae bacterium]|nr:hypothetical protein [Streptosporangiaceae bacterium]